MNATDLHLTVRSPAVIALDQKALLSIGGDRRRNRCIESRLARERQAVGLVGNEFGKPEIGLLDDVTARWPATRDPQSSVIDQDGELVLGTRERQP